MAAINTVDCQKVCLVLTDLRGAYQEGSERIATVLNNLEQETNRGAMPIEPVQLNTDEFYHILRIRLFEHLPSEAEIAAVAQGYKRAIDDAHQMDITSESPAQTAEAIISSYPFHPKIRDLYPRFRENPGYQQMIGNGLRRRFRFSSCLRLWIFMSSEGESGFLGAAT